MRQAGSAQTLDDLSALTAVHDDGLSHLLAWLLVSRQIGACAVRLRFLDLQIHILIPTMEAPALEFHAAEICISCGLASRVFLTEAPILARKQSGEVQESLCTSGKRKAAQFL
jgi:hypothetical protein